MLNKGVDVDDMVGALPAGLERAILRVLLFHVGRSQAIGRKDLLGAVAQHGFSVGDRALRLCINLLRKEGQLICSTGGEDGGYWLAENWDELVEYLQEPHSRAMDLLEQEQAQREAAEKRWGMYSPGKQMALF